MGNDATSGLLAPLLRFHLSVGIRLALRVLSSVTTAFFLFYFILGHQLFHAAMADLLLMGLPAGFLSAAVCLVASGAAARRVCLGLTGWIRHFAVSSRAHHAMAGLAVFAAEFPILIILLYLAVAASFSYKIPVLSYCLGLPLSGAAAAFCMLPTDKKWTSKILFILAAVTAASSSWLLLCLGALLFLAAWPLSGSLIPVRKRRFYWGVQRNALIDLRIAWRALGWRISLPFLSILPVLGLTRLFLINNDPTPSLAYRVVSLGGAWSLVVFSAVLANLLAARRPPWPWARSLPRASRQRIIRDASILGIHSLPVILLLFSLHPGTILPLVAGLPLLSLYAAGRMRTDRDRRLGAAGKVLLDGGLLALLLCLIPPVAFFFLILAPWAYFRSVRSEQNLDVSRWLELHHLAAGDSLSWSDR